MPKPAVILVGALTEIRPEFEQAGFIVKCAPTDRPTDRLALEIRDELRNDTEWDGKLYTVGGSGDHIQRTIPDQSMLAVLEMIKARPLPIEALPPCMPEPIDFAL